MAKYTIELRDLIKNGYNIFDDSWNTFEPLHKQELCNKIIRRYYFYEIGQDTPEMFKFYLNEHLARIMPYYNQLYASELLKIEPLFNMFMEQYETEEENKKRKNDNSALTSSSKLINMCRSLRDLMNETENTNGNIDFKGNIQGTNTKDTTETETTTTEKTTERTENETDDRIINEKFNEAINGTKEITSQTQTTNSSTRLYSDTPQTQIVNENLVVRKDYLTNYTEESGNGTENTTSNETINTTTDRTTDTTDNLTKEIEENITENETENRGLTRNENGRTTEDTTENTKNVNTVDTNRNTETFENGSTKEGNNESKQYTEDEHTNTNKDRKNRYKGFNIDQSTLLMRFRETFLNIDEDIIYAVGNNFMEVF